MFQVEYLNAILDVNANLLVLTVLLRSVNIIGTLSLSCKIVGLYCLRKITEHDYHILDLYPETNASSSSSLQNRKTRLGNSRAQRHSSRWIYLHLCRKFV